MEKRRLSALIAKIFDIAVRDNWEVQYDQELDAFYWARPKLSKKARLTKFLDEFSLYINPRGGIEGMFIEYARNNFVEHHEEFEPLFDALTKKIDGGGSVFTVPRSREKDVEPMLKDLAREIARETLEATSSGELDKLVRVVQKST